MTIRPQGVEGRVRVQWTPRIGVIARAGVRELLHLRPLRALISAGPHHHLAHITVLIEAKEALAYLETGRAKGKAVV